MLFFGHVWLYLADNMDKLQMVFYLACAQGIKSCPNGCAATPLPSTFVSSFTTEANVVAPNMD